MKDIENKEIPLPQRILVVSPNAFTVDLLLKKTAHLMQDSVKLLRLGHSLTDNALNKKYSIDHLSGSLSLNSGERSEKVDELKKTLVEKT